MDRMERRKTPGEPGTYTGQIVEKAGAFPDGATGLYLRLSMGDYRIQCAGPDIAEADLLRRVDSCVTLRGEIQGGARQASNEAEDLVIVTALVD